MDRKYLSIVVDGKEVGICGLKNIHDCRGDIMIHIDPLQRNRGIGKKVVFKLIDHAKKNWGIISVSGSYSWKNEGGKKFWDKICDEHGWIRVVVFTPESI